MNMHRKPAAVGAAFLVLAAGIAARTRLAAAPAPATAILLEGTIVTMNAGREVVHNGRVLVRDGRIAAVWRGPKPPAGVDLTGAVYRSRCAVQPR